MSSVALARRWRYLETIIFQSPYGDITNLSTVVCFFMDDSRTLAAIRVEQYIQSSSVVQEYSHRS
jgi:hypothetical protein